MRFRKSIRITKGIRINFSKSGVSTSVGWPGFSITSGTRGTYLNTGIPGTGLYDRRKISSRSSSRSSTNRSNHTELPTRTIELSCHEDGTIDFLSNGQKIYDQSTIRQVKKSPEYKVALVKLGQQRIQMYNEKIDGFIKVEQLSKPVYPSQFHFDQYHLMEVQLEQPQSFDVPKPTIDDTVNSLRVEAERNIQSFFPKKRRRLQDEYIENRKDESYKMALKEWGKNKMEYEAQESLRVGELNRTITAQFDSEKEFLGKLLDNDETTIDETISAWLSTVELPFDFEMQYSIEPTHIYIDIDLPEIENMFAKKPREMASGIVKMVDKSQKEIKEDYADCVFGLALFCASHVYEIALSIQDVTVSGYTQRRNKVGDLCDDYIYSFKFKRNEFCELNYTYPPDENCFLFENRCNQLASKEFKTIVPY